MGEQISTSSHQYDDYQTSMCTISPIVGGLFFIFIMTSWHDPHLNPIQQLSHERKMSFYVPNPT